MKKKRKNYKPEQTVAIFKQHLVTRTAVSNKDKKEQYWVIHRSLCWKL